MMKEELPHLAHDKRLEDRSAQRMVEQIPGMAKAQESTEQAGVSEVELGGLDEARGEIDEVRPEEVHDVTGLQNEEPL